MKSFLGLLATSMIALFALNGISPAPSSVNVEDVMSVRVEFVVFKSEILLYPNIYAAFAEAVHEWSELIPIEAFILIEEYGLFPWMPGQFKNRSGIIEVHIQDIQAVRGLEKTQIIGVWMWNKRVILLDSDTLTGKPELAKHTARHELGHVFGLPHIYYQGKPEATTGDITIPISYYPESYLMFPIASEGSIKATPSDLEIGLAREYVLHEIAKSGAVVGQDYFCDH